MIRKLLLAIAVVGVLPLLWGEEFSSQDSTPETELSQVVEKLDCPSPSARNACDDSCKTDGGRLCCQDSGNNGTKCCPLGQACHSSQACETATDPCLVKGKDCNKECAAINGQGYSGGCCVTEATRGRGSYNWYLQIIFELVFLILCPPTTGPNVTGQTYPFCKIIPSKEKPACNCCKKGESCGPDGGCVPANCQSGYNICCSANPDGSQSCDCCEPWKPCTDGKCVYQEPCPSADKCSQYCMQENEGVQMESCCVPTAGLVCDDVNECLWNYRAGHWAGNQSGQYKTGESTCVCCEDEYKCDPTRGGCQCRDDLCANRVSCGQCDENNHCVSTCTSTQLCADDGGTGTCKCDKVLCSKAEPCGGCLTSSEVCKAGKGCPSGYKCLPSSSGDGSYSCDNKCDPSKCREDRGYLCSYDFQDACCVDDQCGCVDMDTCPTRSGMGVNGTEGFQ